MFYDHVLWEKTFICGAMYGFTKFEALMVVIPLVLYLLHFCPFAAEVHLLEPKEGGCIETKITSPTYSHILYQSKIRENIAFGLG